ncbi:MAG: hypothetical protein NTV01_06360 [Bacteroidia bacterium]|nr:hypothetical protein [Bacteroidia bacterium]
MKRNILTISLLTLMVTGLAAQNEQDVLRYSFVQTGGTTRSLSLGGAMGAVGGDIAALGINPAGLGIYRKGEFSFTGDYNSYRSNATYLGNPREDYDAKMGFSHFGAVVPIYMDKEGSGIKGLTFGIGYNKLKDYGQTIYLEGVNKKNSLVDEFVYTANDPNTSSWDPFGDGLAWETYLLNYDSIAQEYYSPFDGKFYGQTQSRTVTSQGSLGEYNFSLGANLSDKLYIGTTLGVQKANYSEAWTHSETDTGDSIPLLNSFTYRNTLSTTGSGVNIKIGLLAQPLEFLRFGASIQTGTRLKLHDNFSSDMDTKLSDGQGPHTSNATGESDYSISTPFRATGSLAFLFKQYGLISIDYEYVNYASGRLHASGTADFTSQNQTVSDLYRAASNLRFGAELRFMSAYYARGGYAFYRSPYATPDPDAENNLNIFSAGVGYRGPSYYIDLGFARSSWNQTYFLYGGNSASIANTQTRFSATLGFKF